MLLSCITSCIAHASCSAGKWEWERFVLGINAQVYLKERGLQVSAALARGKAHCPVLYLCPLRQTWAFPKRGSLALPTWGFLDDLKPPSKDQLGPSLRSEGFLSLNNSVPCYYCSPLWGYSICLWPYRQLLLSYTKPKTAECLIFLPTSNMSWLKVFSPSCNPSACTPTSALKNTYASCYTKSPLQPDAPTSTGANKTFPCAHIALCTSTTPVPSPAHFVLLPPPSPLLPTCKGLIQHVNVLQRHIFPTPVLAMGNIKHSGDCCYFIIYEALVISYINNPWLQSVASTVIEYSWGIFVENFHHRFKPRHKNKNHHNKNFICHLSVSTSQKQNLSLFHPEGFLCGGEQNSRVNLEGRFMLHWKEAGTCCI